MNQIWHETADMGQWLNADSPIVGPTDRGLAYGDGVFETVAVRAGAPLFLVRHLQRLRAGLEQLKFPMPALGDDDWQTRCEQVVEKNSIAEGVLKIIVTRGAGARGFAPPADARPVLIVQATQKPVVPETTGFSAVLAPWKIDPASPLCSLKSLSALDKVLAKQWAQVQGADEALFQNNHGHLTEATAWNLFVVFKGQVLTPARHCGLLPGVIRALLLETTTVVEAELSSEALAQADEAFLTNAVGGVRALVRFNGQPIGTGQPGPIMAAMAAHYETLVQTEADYMRRANASRNAAVLSPNASLA